MIIPAKSQFNWLGGFWQEDFLKFQPMRTHYGHWQPCWISNQHQKHKSSRWPSNEHFWQVWFNSVQWFQRRRFKCEKLTDGRTDAYPWQKLTWPMARWAKNRSNIIAINIKKKSIHIYSGILCPNLLLIMHYKLPSSAKHGTNIQQSVDSDHSQFDHEKDTVQLPS